jgi:hypothetical protein
MGLMVTRVIWMLAWTIGAFVFAFVCQWFALDILLDLQLNSRDNLLRVLLAISGCAASLMPYIAGFATMILGVEGRLPGTRRPPPPPLPDEVNTNR